MTAYRIVDEPQGRHAAKFVVDPFWPLLAMMFAGAGVSGLIFALNAAFLRGPTWRREIALVLLMWIGAPAILFCLIVANDSKVLPDSAFKYAALTIVVWKLSFAYWVFFLQQTSHSLHEYFESFRGAQKTLPLGLLLLVAGFLLKGAVVTASESLYWKVIVS